MRSKGIVWGGLLIGAGVFMLAAQLNLLPYRAIVAALGLCGLVLAGITRRPGWAIPGSLLFCIGSAIMITSWGGLIISDSVIFLTSIALSFFLMYLFVYRTQGHWPLIPGFIILAVSFMAFLSDSSYLSRNIYSIISRFWPVGIIAVGVWIIAAQLTKRGRHQAPPPPPSWQANQQPIPPPVRPESATPPPPPEAPAPEYAAPSQDDGQFQTDNEQPAAPTEN